MSMHAKDAIAWARNRGRVLNTETGATGNLVDWQPGHSCTVFLRWETVGTAKLPVFEKWSKGMTVKEPDTCPEFDDGTDGEG